MTHVFVSPHPDDAALSCGGLIAEPARAGPERDHPDRLLGRRRHDNGEHDRLPARRARLRHQGDLAAHRGLPARRTSPPTTRSRFPPAAARRGWPTPTASTSPRSYANTQARQFWQRAAWTRSANITNEETDARPLADSIGGQGTLEGIDFSAADATAIRQGRGRALRLLHGSVGHLSRPARRGLPRLRGRRPAAGPRARRRRRAVRHRCAARSSDSSRRWSTSRSGSAATSTTSCAARSALGLLGEERRWVMPGPDYVGRVSLLRGLPVRLVERLRPAGPTCGDGRAGAAAGARARGALQRHQRAPGAQGRRHAALRQPDRCACSSPTRACSTTSPATTTASRWRAASAAAIAERYWTTVRPLATAGPMARGGRRLSRGDGGRAAPLRRGRRGRALVVDARHGAGHALDAEAARGPCRGRRARSCRPAGGR